MATRKTAENESTESVSTLRERLTALVRDESMFEELVSQARGLTAADEDAGPVVNLPAAVAAATQLAATRRAILDTRATLAEREYDEETRLRAMADRAAADGSWVAASKMIDLLGELYAKREAANVNADLRKRAIAPGAQDSDFYRASLAELLHMQATSSGVAKIQALKEASKVRALLSVAEKAEAGTGPMSDEEVKEAIRDQAPDIPDEHLVLYVQEWCARHNLPMPVRAMAGGRQ